MDQSSLILEAKKEYTIQLIKIVTPFIYQGINTIWGHAKDTYIEELKTNKKASTLKIFQKKLSLIPKWNQDVIDSEYNSIIEKHETCDERCLNKIIEAIFISNIQILSTVKLNNRNKKLNVKVPNAKHFIHRCYTQSAREFYTQPFLFEDRPYKIQKGAFQDNLIKCNKLIAKSIEVTISNMLPIKDILNEYLYETDSDSGSESDNEHIIDNTQNLNEVNETTANYNMNPDNTVSQLNVLSEGNDNNSYEKKPENTRQIYLGDRPEENEKSETTILEPQEKPELTETISKVEGPSSNDELLPFSNNGGEIEEVDENSSGFFSDAESDEDTL